LFGRILVRDSLPLASLPAIIGAVTLTAVQFLVTLPPGEGPHLQATGMDLVALRPPTYILPLLPRPSAHPRPEHVQWVGVSSGRGVPSRARNEVLGHHHSDSTGGSQRHTVRDAPTTIAVSDSGGRVYIAPQVDRQVIRDPSSAAPAYPESLRVHGVEGSATVKFIVDTTGRADSGSFRIVTATNVAFADAIKSALPNMRFEPAILADHTVRQLVQQEFRFVLTRPDTIPTRGRTVRASRGKRDG